MSFIQWVYLIIVIYLLSALYTKYENDLMLKKSDKFRELMHSSPMAEMGLAIMPFFPILNTIMALYYLYFFLRGVLIFVVRAIWWVIINIFIFLRDIFVTKNPNKDREVNN